MKGKLRVFSEEHRRKIAAANRGRVVSSETRHKLSEVKMGENNPFYGKKHTAATKQRISKQLTGHKHSAESKRKMSEARKGKKHSEETKRKIGLANSKQIEFKCDNCGCKRFKKPSQYAKTKHRFCSTKCYGVFRSTKLPREEQPAYKGLKKGVD